MKSVSFEELLINGSENVFILCNVAVVLLLQG
jgi:hypothetical protein